MSAPRTSRIVVARHERIARLTLARPERRNALDAAMADALTEAIDAAAADASVGALLLDAQGEDFCAGADLAALGAMLEAPAAIHLDDARRLGRVFVAMRECPKPVVVAVHGRALAGGAGLATAGDLVLARADASFGYPEVRIGFVPAMVMTMLRRAVGERRAADLVLTGRTIDATEAERIGLISRVLPVEGFPGAVDAIVARLAVQSPEAMARTKRLLYALDTLDFPAGIEAGAVVNAEVRTTAAFRDGVRRFLTKEGP